MTTANGGGTREREFALCGGGNGKHVGAVEGVGEKESECGTFGGEEERERACATINGGGQELARTERDREACEQVFLVEVKSEELKLRGIDRWVSKVNDLWFSSTR